MVNYSIFIPTLWKVENVRTVGGSTSNTLYSLTNMRVPLGGTEAGQVLMEYREYGAVSERAGCIANTWSRRGA